MDLPGSGSVRIRLRPEDRARIAAAQQQAGAQAAGQHIRSADELLQAAVTMTAKFHSARDRARGAAQQGLPRAGAGRSAQADTEEGSDAGAGRQEEPGVARRRQDRTEGWEAQERGALQEQEEDGDSRGLEDADDDWRDEGSTAARTESSAARGARGGRAAAAQDRGRDVEGGDEEGELAESGRVRKAGTREGRRREGEELDEEQLDEEEDAGGTRHSGDRSRRAAAGQTGRKRSGAGGTASGRIKFFHGKGEEGGGAEGGNKTVLRPALQGYNLTWGVLGELEREEARDAQAAQEAFGKRQRERQRPSAPEVKLSGELARSCARDDIVILTWASAAFLDFLGNWVHHLALQEADNFLVGAHASDWLCCRASYLLIHQHASAIPTVNCHLYLCHTHASQRGAQGLSCMPCEGLMSEQGNKMHGGQWCTPVV